MSKHDPSSTNMSLIGAMFSTPEDVEVGLAFLERYRPVILRVAHSRGIRGQDADDVTQDALRKMLAGFHNFQRLRKGSFRSWLRSIAYSATVDWVNGQPRLTRQLAEEMAREIPRSLAMEYETEVMEAVIRKLKLEVQPSTWDMFERTRILGQPAREVADSQGVTVFTVYKSTHRVGKRLQELYALFDRMGDP
jgi:RNA polymerase sigma factor (sigma-70 family)